jgi:hypothetical protein
MRKPALTHLLCLTDDARAVPVHALLDGTHVMQSEVWDIMQQIHSAVSL